MERIRYLAGFITLKKTNVLVSFILELEETLTDSHLKNNVIENVEFSGKALK